MRIPCPASRWWDDVVSTCANIRLFCDGSHVEAWKRKDDARAGLRPDDRVISAVTMWRLAQPWYGDRLDPDWSPRTPAAAQRLLTQVGLTGGFWQLP